MSGYVIGHYNIDNIDKYMEYTKKVGKIVAKYGGKTLIADHEYKILEGNPKQFIVVVQFESIEKAQIWYDSKDYQEIINLRKNSTNGWVLLADEFKIHAL